MLSSDMRSGELSPGPQTWTASTQLSRGCAIFSQMLSLCSCSSFFVGSPFVFCLHLWHRPRRNETSCAATPLNPRPSTSPPQLSKMAAELSHRKGDPPGSLIKIKHLFLSLTLIAPREPECLRRVLRRARTRLNSAASDIPELTFNGGNKRKTFWRWNANCACWGAVK